MTKRYDRAYFDRWYREPDRRREAEADLERQAALALALAESVLGRSVETVLDVGAGEGRWQPALLRHRPGIAYQGVEPSPYAVARWGTRRNLITGDFDTLHALGLGGPFDLVVAADVLHYLTGPQLRRGLLALAPFAETGVAFCPTFTAGDAISGDRAGFRRRKASTYRRRFAEAGLVQLGPWAWVSRGTAAGLTGLERPAMG